MKVKIRVPAFHVVHEQCSNDLSCSKLYSNGYSLAAGNMFAFLSFAHKFSYLESHSNPAKKT